MRRAAGSRKDGLRWPEHRLMSGIMWRIKLSSFIQSKPSLYVSLKQQRLFWNVLQSWWKETTSRWTRAKSRVHLKPETDPNRTSAYALLTARFKGHILNYWPSGIKIIYTQPPNKELPFLVLIYFFLFLKKSTCFCSQQLETSFHAFAVLLQSVSDALPPQRYHRSVSAMFPPCSRRVTAALPPGYRRVTGALSQCYRSVTAVLPPCYRCVTAVLPPCYRCVTAVLPQCYRRVTAVLRRVIAVLPLCYRSITGVFPQRYRRVTAALRWCYAAMCSLFLYLQE